MEPKDSNIQIIVNDEINPVFVRANSALIDKHSPDNETSLEQLWKLEYHAKLIKSDGDDSWSTIQFNTIEERLVFLLKWG
jgi:hypothetical protein